MNSAEPVDGNLNIASSEKKTQGSLRMNIDTRLDNKGARHTRYPHETGDSQKRERVQVQVRSRHADLESTSKHLDDTDIGAGDLEHKQVPGRRVRGRGSGAGQYIRGQGSGAGRGDEGRGRGAAGARPRQ